MIYHFRRLWEYLLSVWSYYRYSLFRRVDLSLVSHYLGANPYSIARQFAEVKGEKELYNYGETPLTTLDQICQRCGLAKNDIVFELGCGRGRACFWLRTVWGCRVVGIDHNPYFIRVAQHIAQKARLQGIEFRCEDLLHTSLEGATALYLYGSNFEEEFIKQLAARISYLPIGTKIITISYPLQIPQIEIVKSFDVTFTWGTAIVFYQQLKLIKKL